MRLIDADCATCFSVDSPFAKHLELIKPASPTHKVVVTQDGQTVTAKYTLETGNTGKTTSVTVDMSKYVDFRAAAHASITKAAEKLNDLAEQAEPTPPKPTEPTPSKYKAGDKVRIIGNTNHHCYKNGDIVTLQGERETSVYGGYYWVTGRSGGYVRESDIEPYTEPVKPEPKQEPIKLYCVKSYEPGTWLTKGKVYEYYDGKQRSEQIMHYDAHEIPCGNWKDRTLSGRCLTEFLYPLVKRPAKVGEWIIPDGKTVPLKVTRVCEYSNCCLVLSDGLHTKRAEYLVLDGYTEPEKPKSKYDGLSMRDLTMKVCLKGACDKAFSKRKSDCPMLHICKSGLSCNQYAEAHPELRDTLIKYLENEDKPEKGDK